MERLAVTAGPAAEDAGNALLEHAPVMRARPQIAGLPVERTQRFHDVVEMDRRGSGRPA